MAVNRRFGRRRPMKVWFSLPSSLAV